MLIQWNYYAGTVPKSPLPYLPYMPDAIARQKIVRGVTVGSVLVAAVFVAAAFSQNQLALQLGSWTL